MMPKRSNPAGAEPGGPRRRLPVDREQLAAISGKVTDLSPQRRDPRRRSLAVDGLFVLGLHEESAVMAGIRLGATVNGAQLVRAYELDQEKSARDSALLLLSMAPRSQRDVMRKLLPRYGAEVSHAVVEWLVAGGWLDDAAFARSYIRAHESFGDRRLAAELTRRGVAREVAQEAIRELLGELDAVAAAREVAAMRLSRMAGVDRDTAQRRLAGFLARRGYDFGTVAEALAPLLADLPRPPRPAGLSRSPGKPFGSAHRPGNSLGRRRPVQEEEEP